MTGRRWARKGVRPTVLVRPGYQNFYVYSAVYPQTGEEVSLFLPRVNTTMMNLFLAHLSQVLNERRGLLVMDQAGWHVGDDLKIPENIELVFLPPYSPELNPVERLWQWLKRHSLQNRFHEDLEAIMDSVQNCLREATQPPLDACAGADIYYIKNRNWYYAPWHVGCQNPQVDVAGH